MPALTDDDFLDQAIQLAIQSANSKGGPFGAVIAKNHELIATGINQVTAHCDPTAHAEVVAIRNACQVLDTYQLDDCTLYASCEPCPMCMSAIYWAHIPRVIFAAQAKDAANAGFDDQFIVDELAKPYQQRKILIEQKKHAQSTQSFNDWLANAERKEY